MKYQIICFLFLTFLLGCNSPKDIVGSFYEALNNGDGEKVKRYTTEDIQIIREGQIVCNNFNELYLGFQWDSVFGVSYDILEMKSHDSLVDVTLSKSDKRLRFLQDTSLVYNIKINLNQNIITRIEVYEYLLFDKDKFHKRLDTLVSWIDQYHPELSGFENDLTIKGAQNYLMAIELYNNSN